jgi:hypothetical protein
LVTVSCCAVGRRVYARVCVRVSLAGERVGKVKCHVARGVGLRCVRSPDEMLALCVRVCACVGAAANVARITQRKVCRRR